MTNHHESQQYEAPAKSIAPSQENIEQAATFVGGVIGKAMPGRHTLTVSTARGVEVALFSKGQHQEIEFVQGSHRSVLEAVLVALEMDGVFGATLRSGAGAANPTAPTELRGWVVTSFSIRGLTDEEIIESYCVDHETGKINSPDPSIAYKAGWGIESANF